MRLIDTHSHIQDAEFDADRDAAIERASQAGVELIMALGVDAASSRLAVALAERNERVLAAAGVHPHDAQDASEAQLDELEELAKHPRVVMVGELGLDYYRNLSPRDQQLRVLRRQLATAGRASKPVAVHAREAHEDMMPLLEQWSRDMGGRLPDGRPLGVLHYFSGDADKARRYIEWGFVISVHTSVTHPRAVLLQEVARVTSIEHLVVETDSPYGAPQRNRGQRNEPAYVGEAVVKIAELKAMTAGDVAETTTRNALRLLGVSVAATGGSGR